MLRKSRAFVPRNRWFESISLQRRVKRTSVQHLVTTARLQAETGIEPLARHLIDGCALGSPQHRVTSSHTATADDRSFLNRDLLKSANFMAGTPAAWPAQVRAAYRPSPGNDRHRQS